MRQGLGGLGPPATGNTFGNVSGVFPGGTSGAGLSNDILVFSGSGMATTVNGGHYCVARGSSLYLGMVTSGVTLTHDPSNPSNPRIDYVIIRTRDPGVDNGVTESAKIVILKGEPAASPVEPTSQLTDGDLLLAAVTVRANASSTTSSDYSDRRLFVVARGGVGLKSAMDTRPGAYEGQYRDNLATNGFERWSGTAWEQVASPAVWTSFTPRLFADSGEVWLGNAGSAFGRYMVNGKVMHLRYEFHAVRPCNMGVGYISSRMPSGFKSAALRESHIQAKLNSVSLGNGPQSIWLGDAFIPPDSTLISFYFPTAKDNVQLNAYRVADTAGRAGGSIPFIPNDYADPFVLTVQGTLEIS